MMGRKPEQISLKRKLVDGQQAHEEMFNITNREMKIVYSNFIFVTSLRLRLPNNLN